MLLLDFNELNRLKVGVAIFYVLRSAFIYKKEKEIKKKFTMNFYEEYLEEVSENITFKQKYSDIKKLELFKSFLILKISPVRALVIPKSTDYDIKEIYAEINKIRNQK